MTDDIVAPITVFLFYAVVMVVTAGICYKYRHELA